MKVTGELLKAIKPKENSKSDKFSWNLYKILNKYKNKEIKIYYRKICEYQGVPLEFNKDSFSIVNALLAVGEYNNDLIGNYLDGVLREGKFKEFYLTNYKLKTVDITQEFFDTYLVIGRCLFDSSHNGWVQYDGDRFITKENERTCNWCGKHQLKMNKIVTKEIECWT